MILFCAFYFFKNNYVFLFFISSWFAWFLCSQYVCCVFNVYYANIVDYFIVWSNHNSKLKKKYFVVCLWTNQKVFPIARLTGLNFFKCNILKVDFIRGNQCYCIIISNIAMFSAIRYPQKLKSNWECKYNLSIIIYSICKKIYNKLILLINLTNPMYWKYQKAVTKLLSMSLGIHV